MMLICRLWLLLENSSLDSSTWPPALTIRDLFTSHLLHVTTTTTTTTTVPPPPHAIAKRHLLLSVARAPLARSCSGTYSLPKLSTSAAMTTLKNVSSASFDV
jgi:hypothetical protein